MNVQLKHLKNEKGKIRIPEFGLNNCFKQSQESHCNILVKDRRFYISEHGTSVICYKSALNASSDILHCDFKIGGAHYVLHISTVKCLSLLFPIILHHFSFSYYSTPLLKKLK